MIGVVLQGALLALERHHAAELRKALSEVRDHCCFLEEENEELSMVAFLNARQIAELQAAAAATGGGGGPTGAADRDRARERGERERARSRSRSRWAGGVSGSWCLRDGARSLFKSSWSVVNGS